MKKRPYDQRNERPPRRLRSRMPAGGPVREVLHPREEGRARRHRTPGALRRGPRDERREDRDPRAANQTGKKVAIVGSGPSGLTAAADLIKLGYDVTVFEALHKAGGVLVYGIPEFRLPKAIVEARGRVSQETGREVQAERGRRKRSTVDELFEEGFYAVFIGSRRRTAVFMNIPGENLSGIYSANEYLTRSNLMKAYRFPEYDTPISPGEECRRGRRRERGDGLGQDSKAPRGRARVSHLPARRRGNARPA